MKDNEIKDPGDEAWDKAKAGKGKEWNSSSPLVLIGILIAAALLAAGAICMFKDMTIPAAACIGAFVLYALLFFAAFAIFEKVKLKRTKSIVGKPGTRKITATVIKSELFSRKTLGERAYYPPGMYGVTVSAVYKIKLTDGVLNYVTLSRTNYKKGDEVEVYINKKLAYIDETQESDLTENTPQETKND